jgi:hypothetical protein
VGCRAITPHLVGLASRLEGRPFHLIATHRQNNPRDEVVAYLRKNELSSDAPTFTVTKAGSHPKVRGNGYVPYYMVFDHHGDLVRHHMCGNYHGGDGLKMIEWVDKLLADAPDIYLGREPFERLPDLAARIGAKRKLAAAVKEAEDKLGTTTDAAERAELERMLAGVKRYRDGALARTDKLIASRPSKALAVIDGLAAELAGTQLGADAEKRAKELRASDDLTRAIAIEKGFDKAVRALGKKKGCKECKRKGMRSLQLGCAQCRAANKSAIAKTRKKLAALIEGADDLPITATVKEYLARLGE